MSRIERNNKSVLKRVMLALTLAAMFFGTLAGPALTASAASPGGAYVVQKGDCLYGIARSQLGDGSRWSEIYELNKGTVKDAALIYSARSRL